MRRSLWLGLGAALGSGATVWVRRRVDRLAQLNRGEVTRGVVTFFDHGARSATDRLRQSVDTGRRAARLRAYELRHELEARDATR